MQQMDEARGRNEVTLGGWGLWGARLLSWVPLDSALHQEPREPRPGADGGFQPTLAECWLEDMPPARDSRGLGCPCPLRSHVEAAGGERPQEDKCAREGPVWRPRGGKAFWVWPSSSIMTRQTSSRPSPDTAGKTAPGAGSCLHQQGMPYHQPRGPRRRAWLWVAVSWKTTAPAQRHKVQDSSSEHQSKCGPCMIAGDRATGPDAPPPCRGAGPGPLSCDQPKRNSHLGAPRCLIHIAWLVWGPLDWLVDHEGP